MAPRRKQLPRPLPNHCILTDAEKRKWRLGRMIGQGGFGLIYLASDDVDRAVSEDTDYVIKVEYHENGPLFSELKFYQRAAKPDIICNWKRSKRLNFLGIPTYWGSGLTEYNGTRYRFMVMDRLGTDLQKVFVGNGEQMKKQTVLQLGYLMVDVLEYIHDNEYVHADIKAANLLLGHRDPGKVYLADYGLSYRYSPNGEHKQYSENPKKGHNGTIEYTSIDAHKGVAPSRRGDLEVLGYCLLHWQSGSLPWLSALRNPSQVQEAKAKLMENLPDSVTQISPSLAEVAQFLLIVRTLDYKEKPDYIALRKVLSDARPQGPLDLSRPGEAARLAVNRNSGQASARSGLVTEDEDANTDCRIRGKSRAQEQTPHKINSAAKTRARTRPVVNYCKDEDEEEEDNVTSPPGANPKTREAQKQRQKHQQSATVQRSRKTEARQTREDEEEDEEEIRPRRWEEYDDDDEYTQNLKNKPDLQQSFRKYVGIVVTSLVLLWLVFINFKYRVFSI